ncbi:MAG: hypothetical protein ACI4UY_14020 [Kiritimatiellia bacterium]
MKKMTFALACASAVAAFAAAENPVISSINFDAYTAGFTGLSLAGDDGSEVAATASRWLYEGTAGATDASTVKAYDPTNTGNPNYLELSTEGGTLWRSINGLSSATTLGAAQEVSADTGLYIDTMVQFTPTEDGGDGSDLGLDPSDKLAIWLNVSTDEQGESVTNLCVRAQFLNYVDDVVSEATTFTLEPVEGSLSFDDASVWHRLTVKAYTLLDDENQRVSAFEIKVDDKAMKAKTSPIGAGMQEMWAGFLTDGQKTLVAANRLFPSLEGIAAAGSKFTLQAVGFKGSGAIDSLQFTTEEPKQGEEPAPEKVDLTISADHATVTGITAGKVEVGSSLTFTVTAAEGYNLTGVTINGTTVTADADGNYTYTVADTDEAVAVVVTVVAAASAYPTYIPDNAAIKSKFDAWVTNKANGDRDAASANMDAFLLNVAPGEVTTAKANFKIVSIEQDANGAWVAKVTGKVGDGEAFGNGYVEIKGSATVDGTYNLATTAETARFFKAFLVLEAPTTK